MVSLNWLNVLKYVNAYRKRCIHALYASFPSTWWFELGDTWLSLSFFGPRENRRPSRRTSEVPPSTPDSVQAQKIFRPYFLAWPTYPQHLLVVPHWRLRWQSSPNETFSISSLQTAQSHLKILTCQCIHWSLEKTKQFRLIPSRPVVKMLMTKKPLCWTRTNSKYPGEIFAWLELLPETEKITEWRKMREWGGGTLCVTRFALQSPDTLASGARPSERKLHW